MTASEVLLVVTALVALGLFAALLAVLLGRERTRHAVSGLGLFEPELIADQARRAMEEIHRAAFLAMAESRCRGGVGRDRARRMVVVEDAAVSGDV